ncbi:XRE family transcriptional regulator [Paraburkholderia caledonica]
MNNDFHTRIRPECLLPWVQGWQQPTGVEVREVISRTGLTGRGVADLVGLSEKGGGRQVRRWISEESHIPYAAWAILCEVAGLGKIWEIRA